ncbi:hypothetical protein EDB80DRAFT_683835 [Ilyonectria destructans]|nr:hypothetical protein EDB80DRAFT_683835 [Ilyonectria destructans]
MATLAVSSPRSVNALELRSFLSKTSENKVSYMEASENSLSKFPVHLSSELCWTSDSFAPLDYVVQLTKEELAAIEDSITSFKALKLENIALIDPVNFPLPLGLANKLRSISSTIHSGRGFAVLRGLKLDDRPDEDRVIAFCGVSSYIGKDRCTNDNGVAMDHLRDAVRDEKPAGREHIELHPSKMMAPLKFHADRKFADILALYVKSTAAIDGDQYLSSAWQVYNDMMESCPDALRILAQDFPWPGVVNDLPETCHTPIIFRQDGRVLCQVVHRIFKGANHLSPVQREALDLPENFANKNSIKLDVQVGGIQLVNNLAPLHARRAWVDRPQQERHYYRLGLRDPDNYWKRPLKCEAVFDDHLHTAPKEQSIPVTDFDPYGLTSLAHDAHG